MLQPVPNHGDSLCTPWNRCFVFFFFIVSCILCIVHLIYLVGDVCIYSVPLTRDAKQILAPWSLIMAEHKTVTNTDVIPDWEHSMMVRDQLLSWRRVANISTLYARFSRIWTPLPLHLNLHCGTVEWVERRTDGWKDGWVGEQIKCLDLTLLA